MDLITSDNMKRAEEVAFSKYHISPLVLMENAANEMMSEITNRFSCIRNMKTAVFCGPGNNGGDGYALARKLFLAGFSVEIFSSVEVKDLKEPAHTNASICQALEICINEKKSDIDLSSFDLIIDALFGTGLKRPVEGLIHEYITHMNNSKKHIISVDIPSGLDCDKGTAFHHCVKSSLTFCLGKAKVGLFTEPGFSYSKETVTLPINIPEKAYENLIGDYMVFDRKMALEEYSIREDMTSKGDYGRVLVIAGSRGMTGAYALCARASMAAGAGYTYSMVPKSRIYEYNQLVPEAICIEIDDQQKEFLSDQQADEILGKIKNIDCMVIGPGLSMESESQRIIKKVVEETSIPVVIDAASIRDMKKDLNILKNKKSVAVITPHPGEMAHLLDMTVSQIQEDRINQAKKFALLYDTIVLLKGHISIVTDGKTVYLNSSGNAGMATAGSGDVLAGMMAGKLARSDNPLKTAAYCMYLHGLAGDKAKEETGENGLMASDIITNIKQAERVLYEEKTRSCMG
ncbi:MAG: NAD(P)H-hydrate dehydratase [Clostridia bacterium]|nr:NAD(P)H-hydrate dehydratase [Clostridia bacterium]